MKMNCQEERELAERIEAMVQLNKTGIHPDTVALAEARNTITRLELERGVILASLTKMAGHRLMQVAQPARELLNRIRASEKP